MTQVKLHSISLSNFRCFEAFDLEPDGEPVLVIGTNAGGKTSLLSGIRRALQGGAVDVREFRDHAQPLELVAKVSGIAPAAQGVFHEALDFSTSPPTLRIGLRATWDAGERQVDAVHGFPDLGWRPAGRAARRELPVISFPAWRDPARLATTVGRQSLLAELIGDLPLDTALASAVQAITAVGDELAQEQPLQLLLGELRVELARILPRADANSFTLGADIAQPDDVLAQLQLLVRHLGPPASVMNHSGGVTQAAIFALALRVLAARPDALMLVDEPEAALHAHAQRALVGVLHDAAEQSVIATHLPMVLDRVDPRRINRLQRTASGATDVVRATSLSDAQAKKLVRYATSHTAETYFAETVIFVEGFSDLLAVRQLSTKLGIALDAAGVSVVSLEGGDLLVHYLQLLGPPGLQLNLRGLCDADKERSWINRLAEVGLQVHDRASLNAAGFFVSDPDLEAELVAPLSDGDIDNVIATDGATSDFQRFAGQPQQAALPPRELRVAYVKNDKIRWAPLLADAIPVASIPASIADVLANL